ncbi:MAG: carboxypeptidase regulatory-like domain-containing protein [Anaerolineae bacterium]|nr:carboxypeptidase regulatory-like domain-containing protein [Anaerolineae bacterium]
MTAPEWYQAKMSQTGQQWGGFNLNWAVSLAGQVMDGLTSEPIPGALVEIVSGPLAFEKKRGILANDPDWTRKVERLDRTFSQTDGIYLFVNLPDGDYQLRVTAPTPSSRYGTLVIATTAATRNGAGGINLKPADVVLPPTALHGQVTDDLDQPLKGVKVQLRGDPKLVLTDSNGKYAFTHLIVSKPTLQISATKFKSHSQKIDDLKAGQDLEITTIKLEKEPG